jgi:hypothetical protein
MKTPVVIEVDDYVPCRVRTYGRPIGAHYLRIGNLKTSLFELILEQESGVIRGFTLTYFDKLVQCPTLTAVPRLKGLPKLNVPGSTARSTDVKREIEVSTEGELAIYWGDISGVDAVIEYENIAFCRCQGELVGAVVMGLEDRQLAMIKSQCALPAKSWTPGT